MQADGWRFPTSPWPESAWPGVVGGSGALSSEFRRRDLLLGAGATALTGCLVPGPDGFADF